MPRQMIFSLVSWDNNMICSYFSLNTIMGAKSKLIYLHFVFWYPTQIKAISPRTAFDVWFKSALACLPMRLIGIRPLPSWHSCVFDSTHYGHLIWCSKWSKWWMNKYVIHGIITWDFMQKKSFIPLMQFWSWINFHLIAYPNERDHAGLFDSFSVNE